MGDDSASRLIVRNNWIIPRQTKIKRFIRPAITLDAEGDAQPYGIAASTQLVGGCTRYRDASKSSHGQGVISPQGRGVQLRTSLQLLPPASQPTVPRAPMSKVRACSNKYTRDRLDFVRPQLVWEMSSCSEMNETAFSSPWAWCHFSVSFLR